MEHTHSPQPSTPVRREAQREQFRLRRVQALTALLDQRRDLRGVSAVADHLDDAVRWSA
jgi:hypothetical protein